jgi:hypothetical protein
MALEANPSGVAPEQVIVFETNGPIAEFFETVRATDGLAWLAEDELLELAQDEDFYVPDDASKQISARVYLVMTNQKALAELLSVWDAWVRRDRKNPAVSAWRKVFAQLRQIRRWGVEDRLRDTGILKDWEDRKSLGGQIPVEVELWCRKETERAAAVARVTDYVGQAGGQVVHQSLIPEIAYHALLVRLPASAVERVLIHRDVELVRADDVHLFRPVPQVRTTLSELTSTEDTAEPPTDAPLGEPIIGLLDGLPLENHPALANRLVVDDPDGWSAEYPVARRRHGTAMASLILHGDLNASDGDLRRKLYVRPILKPHSFATDRENAPENSLFVDLVHRAVKRAVEGDAGNAPAAPGVRIFNFSVGDSWQPFSGTAVSPLARLLDWLAWKYKVLFIVSAGNHSGDIALDAGDAALPNETIFLREIRAEHRLRRLLAPAEAINVLTVGAQNADAATWVPNGSDQVMPFTTEGLPAPFSALGRGYRRSVKPELLAPGGRAVLIRQVVQEKGRVLFEDGEGPKMPGQKVAAPSLRSGEKRGTEFSTGTSNAAALTTRAAARIHDALTRFGAESRSDVIARVPMSVWTKTLLVHTADWPPAAVEVLRRALNVPATTFKDEAAAFLGYGVLRPERSLGSTDERATLLGGGLIAPGQTWLYEIPIPRLLHAQRCWRRLTVTLAWLTPTNPLDRRYRAIAVSFVPPTGAKSALLVSRNQVHGLAVGRGTVQHEVLEGDASVMDVGTDARLQIPVTCLTDASAIQSVEAVPYALAVSLEVAPKTQLRIFEAISQRIRAAVRVGTPS